nr:MAG TPA: hypothetical protein [Caudoviricetes sp.]
MYAGALSLSNYQTLDTFIFTIKHTASFHPGTAHLPTTPGVCYTEYIP